LLKKLDFDTDLNRIPLISDTEPLITTGTEATKTGLLADGPSMFQESRVRLSGGLIIVCDKFTLMHI
jgi:hypothetical protein